MYFQPEYFSNNTFLDEILEGSASERAISMPSSGGTRTFHLPATGSRTSVMVPSPLDLLPLKCEPVDRSGHSNYTDNATPFRSSCMFADQNIAISIDNQVCARPMNDCKIPMPWKPSPEALSLVYQSCNTNWSDVCSVKEEDHPTGREEIQGGNIPCSESDVAWLIAPEWTTPSWLTAENEKFDSISDKFPKSAIAVQQDSFSVYQAFNLHPPRKTIPVYCAKPEPVTESDDVGPTHGHIVDTSYTDHDHSCSSGSEAEAGVHCRQRGIAVLNQHRLDHLRATIQARQSRKSDTHKEFVTKIPQVSPELQRISDKKSNNLKHVPVNVKKGNRCASKDVEHISNPLPKIDIQQSCVNLSCYENGCSDEDSSKQVISRYTDINNNEISSVESSPYVAKPGLAPGAGCTSGLQNELSAALFMDHDGFGVPNSPDSDNICDKGSFKNNTTPVKGENTPLLRRTCTRARRGLKLGCYVALELQVTSSEHEISDCENDTYCHSKQADVILSKGCNAGLQNVKGKARAKRASSVKPIEINSDSKPKPDGLRPFSCPHCNKSFGQATTLRTHVRTHTGEKPYGCAHCPRAFTDYSTYKKHLRVHTGEKPYICDICERAFTQSGNMYRHRKRHDKSSKPKVKTTVKH